MSLELSAEKAQIFRITHIKNVPWILANGVHCRNGKVDPDFVEIGNPDLIRERAPRLVEVPPGGTLSDYVPFYFTPFSPMLYNIKTGWGGIKQRPMSEIVILVTSLRRLSKKSVPFLFTDRHAYLKAARYRSDLSSLGMIDWQIIQARDFKRDPEIPDKLERYQAEALVHRMLPIDALLGIACHNPGRLEELESLVKEAGCECRVACTPGWYH